ncbi:MAG: hydrolase, partial [Patescibacteria group bacterium]
MTEEYLDILDERGEKIGQQRSYIDAHKEGLIHKIAHVWILNSKKELLIQKRSHDRSAHPDYWDISV